MAKLLLQKCWSLMAKRQEPKINLCSERSGAAEVTYSFRKGVLLFFFLSLLTFQTKAQFSGDFAPSKWTFSSSTSNGDGSVNTSGAPNSIILNGSDNDSGGMGGKEDYSVAIPVDGTISFSYSHENPDIDAAYYVIDGAQTLITSRGSGSKNDIAVNSGQTFSFRINNSDNCCGRGVLTITDFVFTPAKPKVTLFSQTNVTCIGGENGAAEVSVSNGTAPYTYSWAPSGGSDKAASGLAAGTYTVTVTDAKSKAGTLEVIIKEPSVLVLTGSTLSSATVASAYSQNITASGGTPPYSYSIVLGSIPGLSLSTSGALTGTPNTAGNYNISIKVTDACGSKTSDFSLEVGRANQTITFSDFPATKSYGDTDFTLNATSSSGLPLSYTSSNTAVATVSGNTVHILSKGSTTITAKQAGSDNYNLKEQAQSLDVLARPITVTLNAAPLISKVYNKTTAATLVSQNYSLNNLVEGDEVNISGSAVFDNVNAGTNKQITVSDFVLSGTDKDNYKLLTTSTTATGTITPLEISGSFSVQNKVYDGTASATISSRTVTPLLADTGTLSLTGGTATFDNANAGTDKIVTSSGMTLGGAAAGNYKLTSVSTTKANITTKPITVAAKTSQSKIYGSDDPVFTYTVNSGSNSETLPESPLVDGDKFTGNLAREEGENVGNTYAIKQGTLSAGDNYTITYLPANFSITAKPITVTAASGQTKVYGSPDPTFEYTISAETQTLLKTLPESPLVAGDKLTGSLSRVEGENVGTSYEIRQGTLTAGINYAITYIPANFSITPKPITVTADAGQTKVYGSHDPILSYSVSTESQNLLKGIQQLPLVGDDKFTGALSRTEGENVGDTYKIGQGTLTAGNNYTITYVSANFSITAKPITVTADAGQTKVYGSHDPVLTYTVSTESQNLLKGAISQGPLVGNDQFSGSLSRTEGENAGNTYKIGQGTLTAGDNYLITFQPADFSITAKPITVTAKPDQTKVYGSHDPIFSYTVSAESQNLLKGIQQVPLVGDDKFTGSLSRTEGENVGTNYEINQGNLTAGNNYTITYIPANFSITAKQITVTADAGQTKVYGDADPVFAYSLTSGALVSGDHFSGTLVRAEGEKAGVYAIKNGSLALSSNYVLSFIGAEFVIGKKDLTITADNKSKFAGTANPVLTVSYSGFANSEDKNVLSQLPALKTTAELLSPIGEYPITASGAASDNYAITYKEGVLSVKPGAPTSVSLSSVTIYENAASGTIAGTLSSTSDDPNATFTYSLVSGNGSTDNSLFSISGNQIRTAASLNFEQKAVYSIRVRSTTQHGFSLDKEFSISISDVNEQPTIADIADQTICYTISGQTINLSGISAGPDAGQSTTLSVSSTNNALFSSLEVSQTSNGNAELSYRISNGATGTATLTVMVQDNGGTANGGSDMIAKSFTITVNPLPVISISSNIGTTLSKGQTAELTAASTGTYQWRSAFGIISGQNTATLTVRPEETSTYTVTVTNANGCSTEQSITIVVNADYEVVKGTNIISPNGDGINDRFIIKNIDMYPKNEVKIFDRAGRLLYSQQNYTDQWDGTLNGSPLAEDTYYYVVDFGPGITPKKGFITIVKD